MGDPQGLQILDWSLIALYALFTIGLGVYFGRKQTSTEEYFVGGRNINPLLIGVSLFATLLSTISYLSMPGEGAGKGPVFLVSLLAYPLIYIVVAYGLLPAYMNQKVTSAYEILEERLGLNIRLLGALMFLALRLVWMTLLVRVTAEALCEMMGVVTSEDQAIWIPRIVIATGVISIIYTSIGGLRAVVVTDFMQTVLLFGGALLVILIVTMDFGGFGWFPTQWQPTWDEQPVISFDPSVRLSMVGTILMVFVWYVATIGGDQTSVQRFMATSDVRAARRALLSQLGVSILIHLTLFLVGFALLSFYTNYPDQLPKDMTINANADKLFPKFIAYELPVGISGLVVAGMFAAAMSSIDSGVNSITAVVLTDFVDRLNLFQRTQKSDVMLARSLSVVIGLMVVIGSSYFVNPHGNITAVTNKTVNLLTTPIFGLFCYALFLPNSSAKGVWAGTLVGIAVAGMISFSGPIAWYLHTQFDVALATMRVIPIELADGTISCTDPISFQWIGPVALTANLIVGTLVSRVTNPAKAH